MLPDDARQPAAADLPETEEQANGGNPGPNQGQEPSEDGHDGPQRAIQTDIIRQCTDAAEAYRRGEIAKPVAVARIGAQLSREDAGLDAPKANAALKAYLEMLDGHEKEQGGEGGDSGQRDERGAPERGRPGDGGAGSGRSRVPEIRRSSSQTFAGGEDADLASEHSSHDEREPGAKRPKLDTSAFPWNSDDLDLSDRLNPELRETLRLLRVYAADVKGTKLHLINSIAAPEFPDSEWTNILHGRAVDLDRVFTGH